MKTVSLLLVLLLLLQSCTVYNKTPTSVETAVAAGEKAKVNTTDNQSYIFKHLENKNNQLTGITTLRSVTSKKLSGTPGEIDGKYMEYDLSGLDIREIKLRNESASILGSIAAIAGFLVAAWFTVLLVSPDSSEKTGRYSW